MKKILSVLVVGSITLTLMSVIFSKSKEETQGIKFKETSLENAKKESLSSGKLIFIDAHTSWCGPCKRMAATSFMDENVGKLYNEKFINLKIDCEKDPDGPEISRLYKISMYPTLLIIDGNGKKIKEIIGFQTSDQLIAIANSIK
jgi:thiol-disulfide isomerase/thioredoxin